jgi:isopenicillin N synthase-like dioxygenase
MEERVPELSLADYTHGSSHARENFSTQLSAALQRYGFFVLRKHSIPSELLESAYALSAQLFDQPEAFKRQFMRVSRGYTPFRTEHAKNHSVPDLKEFWQIGPEDNPYGTDDVVRPPNVWPSVPHGFKDTLLALYSALELTGRILLEALTPSLDVPRDFFEQRVHGGNSVLRLIHYPPVPEGAEPGSIRSAPHEDINLITLLVPARGPGLELLDRDGRWLPVHANQNDLIVDSGDMLARMTNNVIPATTHRVVNPAGANVSRYSLPFFVHPRSDIILSCIPSCLGSGARYSDITAGAFLEQRLREIGLITTTAAP